MPVTRVVGSVGWAAHAGDVAVVGQIDNVVRNGDVYLGDGDAAARLWIWRPPATPPAPRPLTGDDAVNLVEWFLGSWEPGLEPYRPTMATTDVIETTRAGTDGVPALEGWTFRSWNSGDAVEVSDGVFEVTIELLREGDHVADLVFGVGPGVTADGRNDRLVVVDVRPG